MKSAPSPSSSSSSSSLWEGAFTDSPRDIALALLVCNFVGIAFAKSLHWQFYAWYAHSLPIIVAGASALPLWATLPALLAIEVGFSWVRGSPTGVGDHTHALQAWLINAGHLVILIGALLYRRSGVPPAKTKSATL